MATPEHVADGTEKDVRAVEVDDENPAPTAVPVTPTSVIIPTTTAATTANIQQPAGQGHRRSFTVGKGHTVSVVLITSALEMIAGSREARRSAPLRDSTQHALQIIRANNAEHAERQVFEPLRLACETRSEKLMIASLDCISKLIAYSFFDEEQGTSEPVVLSEHEDDGNTDSGPSGGTLIELVVNTITACHSENTPEAVSLQIVKALLSLVLSPTLRVHHSALLRAVRTVYNVFLLSNDPVNQAVAQGGLTQMVNHVFSQHDLFVKDAFLVFRALCKLTMKPLNTESERDLKSHAMRSKLLALRLVLTVMSSHMPLFADPRALVYSSAGHPTVLIPTPPTFAQAITQYLCLALARNAVSAVPSVFDLAVALFWRTLSGLRAPLKREIGVLLREIFLPMLELRAATTRQKAALLGGLVAPLCADAQALVEVYLNYDCAEERGDVWESLMDIISKMASTSFTAASGAGKNEPSTPTVSPSTSASGKSPMPITAEPVSVPGIISEKQLRRQALECLVEVLRSLVAWGSAATGVQQVTSGSATQSSVVTSRSSLTGSRSSVAISRSSLVGDVPEATRLPSSSSSGEPSHLANSNGHVDYATGYPVDDPSRFESAKQKKTTLLEGIKKFNFEPKKGIQFLIDNGFIASTRPHDIARFLYETDGLSKTMIGDYLGEGEPRNVAIMHAFVDQLDFHGMPFVAALREFLQSFRLPGESQKIDRFMLKFADRYIAGNSNAPFANAAAPYVLAYSVIMLNTDQHSPQVKKRMTVADFIKNNRGINKQDEASDEDGNLPEDFLTEIFEEIQNNEIRMRDEDVLRVAGLGQNTGGIASALVNVGRDLQREQYVLQSHGMASKTEALFREMIRSQRRGVRSETFFGASHFLHVRPMFEVAWIPFLAGLSGPLQETDDMEVVELCLEGFKRAIHIVCTFDLELERSAFVTTLAKFTFLNNLGEMKPKNMEAIKTLLDVAVTEGNNLRGSWHEVLTCVSQLEHMQLISSGVEIDGEKKGRPRKLPTEELANESRSRHITVAADMVFSLSHYLNGTAIVDFVQALCDVSWEEIQSSGLSRHPRLFSLQKLVDISYYNMNRIRIEWSSLWEILGEHFNQVCCHNNPHVGFFALDALRQLAMRFLEKEELQHFKFQKDFLRPFEYTMTHNNNPDIRDLVLVCLQQMIQARAQNIRSGWRTMFGVFSSASRVLTERIANVAFEIVTQLNRDHFNAIVRNGALADLTVCITAFCKVQKFQKISLLAIAMLRGVIPKMLDSPECPITADGPLVVGSTPPEDIMMHFWFPVLFGFYDIIMNGEDLEVRRLALDSLFSALKTYGSSFPVEFWDTVCQELLFTIFSVLRSSQDVSRFSTQEDLSVWMSTTMIQALRDLTDLYTFYFEKLERFLDGLLDLFCVCICQDNETLAHIGTSCLQQLLEDNVEKLSSARWERVVSTFIHLFMTSTPHQLFDESLREEIDGGTLANGLTFSPDSGSMTTVPPTPNQSSQTLSSRSQDAKTTMSERRRVFRQIIVKCILQLLLIETVSGLLRNPAVYGAISPENLLRLMSVLDRSYQFARSFNEDKDLRTALWKLGFMKHLPNLLKQESSSAATLVHVLSRMYFDERESYQNARTQIAERLLPLGRGVMQDYNKLRADTQGRNIVAWTPVVAEIMDTFCRLDDKAFQKYLPVIYPLAADLLDRDIPPEIRRPLKTYFSRVGTIQGIMEATL
ncbi:Sec7-domain-containing protein [Fistulina hepatica ATCC 64428]|uniref:Sec7-domain-containing protein n=1 Tax=Fistulina hepatica ATCC 64428 TaxID=1128425 RepID=A0A0D7AIP8_9AGAR|nr:Sec7-domain-containing protein [Fistulina hepatica ATCC 64428]